MHLVLGGFERLFVGPDLPGEHDLFPRLSLNRFAEVSVLALGECSRLAWE
jgi:hypothetical protein